MSDDRDGALFRFWIRMAQNKPSKIAIALAPCLSEEDYRRALEGLAAEERINLPEPDALRALGLT